MNPPPARRPALQRPGAPEHPFSVRVVDDDPEPTPAPVPVTAPPLPVPVTAPPPPAPVTAPPAPSPSTQPAATAVDDARRLKGGRKSYAGMATTVTFLSPEEYDRVRRAYAARGLRDGWPSMNEWMCGVILDAVKVWEERYHDGEEFGDADAQSRGRRRR